MMPPTASSCSLASEELNEKIVEMYAALSRLEYSNLPICEEEHLVWKYLKNPFGGSRGVHAYEGAQLIGRLSYQKRDFDYQGSVIRGANLSDLLVHPKKRSLPIFLELTRLFFGGETVSDLDFSMMIPNGIALPLYKKILGLVPCGKMPVYVLPLNLGKLLSSRWGNAMLPAGKLLGKSFQWISKGKKRTILEFRDHLPSHEDYVRMIRRWQSPCMISGSRNYRWHRWRFFEDTMRQYEVLYHYLDNELRGYTVTRILQTEGLYVLAVIDFVSTLRQGRLISEIQREIFSRAQGVEADMVLSMHTDSAEGLKEFSQFPFLRVPNYLLPMPIEFFVLPYSNKKMLPGPGWDLSVFNNWYLTLADFDIY